MKAKEILELHKTLSRRMRRDARENDQALLELAQSKGWEVLRGSLEQMIAELLEPVEFDYHTTLEVRSVVNESREKTLKALRAIIAIPDTVLAAHKSQIDDKRARAKESA